jgi:hypothetical protein
MDTGLTNTDVQSLAISGTNLFAGTSSGVFLSTTSGASWKEVNTGLTNTNVLALSVSGTSLFAGAYGGFVFLSTNTGTSWNAVDSGLTNSWIIAFAVSGTNIFAGTDGNGAFVSTNNGTSWTAVDSGLTNSWVSAFAVSGTNLFAGTSSGVFLSTKSGASWKEVNTGLTNTNVLALSVSGTNLFAGTGDGVWRRPLSEITSVGAFSTNLPAHFSLGQNFPNPFNPSTTIKFELAKSSMVTLSVFDILGRVVSVLVNERRNAGVHEVKFDGSNLASGVYFYRLQAGDFVQSKRLLILK